MYELIVKAQTWLPYTVWPFVAIVAAAESKHTTSTSQTIGLLSFSVYGYVSSSNNSFCKYFSSFSIL